MVRRVMGVRRKTEAELNKISGRAEWWLAAESIHCMPRPQNLAEEGQQETVSTTISLDLLNRIKRFFHRQEVFE